MLDFIYDRTFTKKCAQDLPPSLHPEVDNKLPEGGGLIWLDWDFIRNNDLNYLCNEIREIFLDEQKKKK